MFRYRFESLLYIVSFFSFLFVPSLSFASRGEVTSPLQTKQGTLSHEVPKELEGVGITEKLGESIDLNLEFYNEEGEKAPLKTYFDGKRPVLLTLVYYSCPNLCNFHLNGVTQTLKKMDWTLGDEFDMIAVSIDPKEKSSLAKKKKENYVQSYGRPSSKDGWHFLTGDEAQIQKLASQVGFGYKWDHATKQWVHQAAAYVLTPEGKISRYLYGIDFASKTLRLSLVEASDNKIGNIVDRIVLFCLHYDPIKGTYAFYAINFMRLAAALTVVILVFALLRYWRRQKI